MKHIIFSYFISLCLAGNVLYASGKEIKSKTDSIRLKNYQNYELIVEKKEQQVFFNIELAPHIDLSGQEAILHIDLRLLENFEALGEDERVERLFDQISNLSHSRMSFRFERHNGQNHLFIGRLGLPGSGERENDIFLGAFAFTVGLGITLATGGLGGVAMVAGAMSGGALAGAGALGGVTAAGQDSDNYDPAKTIEAAKKGMCGGALGGGVGCAATAGAAGFLGLASTHAGPVIAGSVTGNMASQVGTNAYEGKPIGENLGKAAAVGFVGSSVAKLAGSALSGAMVPEESMKTAGDAMLYGFVKRGGEAAMGSGAGTATDNFIQGKPLTEGLGSSMAGGACIGAACGAFESLGKYNARIEAEKNAASLPASPTNTPSGLDDEINALNSAEQGLQGAQTQLDNAQKGLLEEITKKVQNYINRGYSISDKTLLGKGAKSIAEQIMNGETINFSKPGSGNHPLKLSRIHNLDYHKSRINQAETNLSDAQSKLSSAKDKFNAGLIDLENTKNLPPAAPSSPAGNENPPPQRPQAQAPQARVNPENPADPQEAKKEEKKEERKKEKEKEEEVHPQAQGPQLYRAHIQGHDLLFRRRPVPRDGDCAYHALGLTRQEVFGRLSTSLNSPQHGEALRQSLLTEMWGLFTENPDLFGQLVGYNGVALEVLSEEEFRIMFRYDHDALHAIIEYMTSPFSNVWLTYNMDLEDGIMNAIARIFNLDIHILAADHGENEPLVERYHAQTANPGRSVYMIHVDNNTHFDLLDPLGFITDQEHEVVPVDPDLEFRRRLEDCFQRDEVSLNCEICFENQVNRVLPCGHTYCADCIDKLGYHSVINDALHKSCPQCRALFAQSAMLFLTGFFAAKILGVGGVSN